jgi:hypothetical protein
VRAFSLRYLRGRNDELMVWEFADDHPWLLFAALNALQTSKIAMFDGDLAREGATRLLRRRPLTSAGFLCSARRLARSRAFICRFECAYICSMTGKLGNIAAGQMKSHRAPLGIV